MNSAKTSEKLLTGQVGRYPLAEFNSLGAFFEKKQVLLGGHCSRKWLGLQVGLAVGAFVLMYASLQSFSFLNESTHSHQRS